MEKTNKGSITPGGRPAGRLENPPFKEAGPTDSGEGQLLLNKNQIQRSASFSIAHSKKENNEEVEILKQENKTLKQEIDKLKNAMDKAQEEIRRLIEESSKQKATTYCDQEYYTDEEELIRETEWILNRDKKRKAERSPETMEIERNTIKRKPVIDESEIEWTQIKSKNKKKHNVTEPPEKAESGPRKQQAKTPKVTKPPPIIISNVKDYKEIKEKLQIDKYNCSTSMLNNNQIKVNVRSDTEYRELTSIMNSTKFEWHTYENKNSRPIRMMARNLHPSTPVEDIKKELEEKNYKIREVIQKFKKNVINNKVEYNRLPLYTLVFDSSEDISKIYNIQYINHMKVKIEAMRNNKMIPQCKKCQRYGHTQRFCNRKPNCVKCAGNHITVECTKGKNIPAKCINCSEAHPANYRGCIVAKELQKRRDNSIKEKEAKSKPKTFFANKVKPGISYSQAAQNKLEEPLPATTTTEHSILQILQTMMNTLERVNERLDKLEIRSTNDKSKKK